MTQERQIRQAIKHLETAAATLRKLLQSSEELQEKTELKEGSGELCLECKKPLGDKHSRGLCNACYHAARRQIRQKSVTEDELMNAGRLGQRDTPGRKSTRNYLNLPPVAKTQELQVETTKPPESSVEAKPRRGKK